MEISILKELGLTDGEIKVYDALLELNSSSTGEISRKSGVHTSKVYPILDRLIQKGLASFIYKGKIRMYQVTPPKNLLDIIEHKKRDLEEKENKIRELVSKMEIKREDEKRQWAAVFEGKEGIRNLFEIMLDEWQDGEDYLVFAPGEEFMDEDLNKFFKKHHLKRIEKGIIVKVIALKSQEEYYKKEYENIPGFEFRFTKNSIPAAINIVHNKVSTIIWSKPPNAFVIDSEIAARKYRIFFNTLWNDSV